MRSKASYRGHPIHPMLIPFPFAFLIGAFVFDAVGLYLGSMELSSTAKHLTIAGIGMGLLAAIPGAVDYFGSVPPRSSGKIRATKHALTNVLALLFFALSLILRTDGQASTGTLFAQLLGVTLLGFAGYMGGTLVYRNQIGVDHRYADAGRWQEVSIPGNNKRIVVAATDDLKPNQIKLVQAGDNRVALCRTSEGYRAIQDRCTHKGGPLSDGVLICGTVQCPWHGSQFDVKTGDVKAGPAKERIAIYAVEESDGKIRMAS
jgi:nitrite reductase/ring-hydroxylating ferredoxin subunit/uncharacterized membrane protein